MNTNLLRRGLIKICFIYSPSVSLTAGSLVKDFILGDASPEAYTTLVSKEGSLYNPFNLICIEFR